MMKVIRGNLLKAATLGAAASGLPQLTSGRTMNPAKTHIVTLSFDDGFRKSFYQTAEIYEEFGLRACLNVIATGHLSGTDDASIIKHPKGDFTDWNLLKKRGHEVMPHTFDHTNLTEISLPEAEGHFDRCIVAFEENLDGFRATESVYNFAYNASTPELEALALKRFMAIRTQGETPINPIPTRRSPARLGCFSAGPDNIDAFLSAQVDSFLASPGGWFVFNTHGLDDEGWGPISAKFLRSLLGRLVKLPHVEVLPAGEVLLRLPSLSGADTSC